MTNLIRLLFLSILALNSFPAPNLLAKESLCYVTSANRHISADSIKTIRPPLEKRSVSGYLSDERRQLITGATVQLIIGNDTLATTSERGRYELKDVRKAEFTLVIRYLGLKPFIRKYHFNDTLRGIHIPTLTLDSNSEFLDAIEVSRLPGAVIKGDTVEYYANDYIVREFATLKNLLERMEGVTLDLDGNLFHNGEPVKKALFNNEKYFTGSIKEIINELPVHVVDRVQFIERNKDQPNQPKDAVLPTEKVMNVVSKPDKSAGKMTSNNLELGSDQRQLYWTTFKRIDGPKQTSISANYKNTIPGLSNDTRPGTIGESAGSMTSPVEVAMNSGTSPGGSDDHSGGHDESAQLNLAHQFLLKNWSFHPSYGMHLINLGNVYLTEGEELYPDGLIRNSSFRDHSQRGQNHFLTLMLQNRPTSTKPAGPNDKGKSNFQINSLSFKGGSTSKRSESTHLQQRLGWLNALEYQTQSNESDNQSYHHMIQGVLDLKPMKTRLSLTASTNLDWNQNKRMLHYEIFSGEEHLSAVRFYPEDFAWSEMQADSSLFERQQLKTENVRNNLMVASTWRSTKVASFSAQLSLRQQYTFEQKHVQHSQNGETYYRQPELDMYSKDHDLTIPLTLGSTLQCSPKFNAVLKLEWHSRLSSNQWAHHLPKFKRFDQFADPSINLNYNFGKFGTSSLGFGHKHLLAPTKFYNPDTIYLSPFALQVGNPDLKPSNQSTVNARYSASLKKIGLSLSLSSNYSKTHRDISTDRVVDIDSLKHVITTISRPVNLSGGHKQNYALELTQQLRKLGVTIKYRSSVFKSKNQFLSNGQPEFEEVLLHTQTLSMPIRANKWLDMNWDLHYSDTKVANSLRKDHFGQEYNREFTAAAKFHFFLPKQVRVSVHALQALYEMNNLLSRPNPLVLNANMEKRLLKDKSLILSAVVMDLAEQNHLTKRISTPYGYSNVVTNPNSRYYLLQLSWRPQIWYRSKFDAEKGRKGDGSYIQP